MDIRRHSAALLAAVLLFAAALPRAGAVAADDAPQVAYAGAVTGPARILEIRKLAADGKTPLPGVVFMIYKVATLAQLETGETVLRKRPTQEDVRTYGVPEALIATLTTDPEGLATFNFTAGGHPDGIYMVVELPDVYGVEQEPFFLRVPGSAEGGSGDAYSVEVCRKSIEDTAPEISVDVGSPGQEPASSDIFRPHVRVLRADIPTGIANARKYTLSDTLPPQLSYVWGSPVVKLYTTEGEERQLLWDGHFYVSEVTLTGEGEPRDHFTVALTRRGLTYIMDLLGEGNEVPELRVYYEACIDADSVVGESVFSKARVEYINQYGVEYIGEAESTGICTGGLRLRNTDAEGRALPDARFRIARRATEEELTDPGAKVESLTVDGRAVDVVFVSFVPGDDLSAPRVDAVTADGNGDAAFFGLAYGTYYIVETRVPAGFELLNDPIEVRIDESSHRAEGDRDPTLLVTTPRFILPQTGRLGMELFTPVGLGVVCCASLMLLLDHRRGKL